MHSTFNVYENMLYLCGLESTTCSSALHGIFHESSNMKIEKIAKNETLTNNVRKAENLTRHHYDI